MVTAFRDVLKRKFLAGLVVIIPVVITVMALVWFFEFIDGIFGPLYNRMFGYYFPGIGFVLVIVFILLIGIISTNVIGKKIIWLLEIMITRLPGVKGIYSAIKQLVDAFSPENTGSFKRFVIVEYPRAGSYSFGFLTKEWTVKVDRDGRESYLRAVYVPTNHLYLGDIVLFRDSEVFYTDIPIEEGIKMILSGGIASPSRISEAK